MNRKALFLDLDGTLYDNHTKTIPLSTKKALNNLLPEVDVFLATGRSAFTLRVIETVLPFFKGLVLLNGQHVIYKNSIIYHKQIKPEYLKKLVELTQKLMIPIGLVATDKAYIYSYTEDIRRFFCERASDNIIDCLNDDFDFTIPIAMVWVFASTDKIDLLKDEIHELSFLKWGKYGCDVVSFGDSKKNGLEQIIEIGPYQYDHTYAIGNGDNDVEMFKMVKHSAAMAKSSPLALKNASFITSDINEDGLYKALEFFGLLKS